MRRGKAAALVAFVAGAVPALAAPALAAPSTVVGQGREPGVAVGGAGVAYVAFKTPARGVELCVLPHRATGCTSRAAVALPPGDVAISRLTVLLGAPGVVDVVAAREGGTYLSRSVDSGRTFAPAVRLMADSSERAARLADGRIALVGGAAVLKAAAVRADGADGEARAAELSREFTLFASVAALGADTLAAGSAAGATRVHRLPAGASGADPAAWAPLPDLAGGREPSLAAGPGGAAVLLESASGDRPLFVQRLLGADWSRPVEVGGGNANGGHALARGADDRLSAVSTYTFPQNTVLYSTSADGGTMFSPPIGVARPRSLSTAVQVATGPRGRGAVVAGEAGSDKPVHVIWLDPREAPARTLRVRGAVVQAEAACRAGDLRVRVRASRDGRIVRARTVLRSVTVRARGARRVARSRFSARLRPRASRRRVTVSVRLRPRGARARARRVAFRAGPCRS